MHIDLMRPHTAVYRAGMAPTLGQLYDQVDVSTVCAVTRRQLLCLLVTPPLPRQRGGRTVARRLLYAGAIPGHSALFARVALVRLPDQEQWSILVWLWGQGDLTGYIVRLTCGDDERTAVTDATGEAGFDDIPADWIVCETAPDLIVTIR